MAAKPAPASAPAAPTVPAPGEPSTVGDVWAFRLFAILFLGTLVIGLFNFLGMKYFK